MAEPHSGPGEPPVVAQLSNAQTATNGSIEQQIDPWSVSAAKDAQGNTLAFDYEAISKKWNTSLIDQALIDRLQRLTGATPHRWLRRGLFFSHRDFSRILDCYEKGERFLIYTGRGPSSDSMHIGHTIPFEFTKWLQDVFDMPLVIMLTDDEKFLFKDGLKIKEAKKFARENAKDIAAVGFDPKKTFIYSDFEYMGGHFYENSIEFSSLLPNNQVRGAFGFDGSVNIGRNFFPAVQCAAAFASSYPEIWGDDPRGERQKKTTKIQCLIPMAIDQDPYFRLLRENSHRMTDAPPKAALIHSKFLTALQGAGGKMSASDPNSAIFMNDSKKDVQRKINKHAFSGGQTDMEEHRRLGGRADIDVSYQYLTYFMEDDEELEVIRVRYEKGDLLTGELKKIAIELMQKYVAGYQQRRTKVTDDVLKVFMTPRKLEWGGNKNPNPQAGSKAGSKVEPKAATDTPHHDADAGVEGSDTRLPQRPREDEPGNSSLHGIQGLSKYADAASSILYPKKSKSND